MVSSSVVIALRVPEIVISVLSGVFSVLGMIVNVASRVGLLVMVSLLRGEVSVMGVLVTVISLLKAIVEVVS